jgi:hypothetical protein
MAFRAQGARLGRGPAVLVAAALALVPALAAAKPGDGLRLGPGRLKLGAELDGRWDSFVGAGQFGLINDTRVVKDPGDGIGRARGVFSFDLPGQAFRANFSGLADWNQYLGLVANTRTLSFFGANLAGGMQVNPNGHVSFELSENLSRSDRAVNPVFGLGVIALNNATQARLRFRPGGGAIEAGLSYNFGLQVFSPQVFLGRGEPSLIGCPNEACNPDLAAAFNSMDNGIGADVKWRFLPKTGVTLEANYGFRTYLFGNEFVPNVPAQPLRIVGGFGTLLNTRLSFAIRGGYQAMFFQNLPDETLHTWLGQAELGFRLTETFQLRGGFQRHFEPVGGTARYFGTNRVYLEFKGQFQRLVLTALGSVDVITFGNDREDLALALGGRAEYHLNGWLRLTAALSAISRTSTLGNFEFERGQALFSFTRWEASTGVATLF